MSGYKLYYFDVRGRAEIVRLSFVAANMEYEDIRFTREEWVKEKESGRPPLGQAPFLVTPDGKVLGQSQAIMKYVCRIGGLSPTDSFDEAIADMIVGGVEDFFQALIKAHMEKEEAKKTELMKEFFEETLANRLPKYENILKANNEGRGFFVGDKLTYADIIFFDLMNLLEKGEPTAPKALEKFPLLAAHHKRVLDVPEIKKWVETRPKTEH
nr:glutathione S-transferase 1-like [Pocillopora verrucosa]